MLSIPILLLSLGFGVQGVALRADACLFFAEGLEDTGLRSRGWYDDDRFTLFDDAVAGRHPISYHFRDR